MERLYTYGLEPVLRNVTLAELVGNRCQRRYTQVTADTFDEAAAAVEAGIDTLSCGLDQYDEVRRAAPNHFIITAIPPTKFVSDEEVLGAVLRVTEKGSDAIFTNRPLPVIECLAREGIAVMSHLGMNPRKSSWYGGLRVLGKKVEEATAIFQQARDLENAGAFAAEIELVAEEVLEQISTQTDLVTFSLGSGPCADVIFLYACDIFGEAEHLPRHARAYANLLEAKRHLQTERITAFRQFQAEVESGNFPTNSHSASMFPSDRQNFLGK